MGIFKKFNYDVTKKTAISKRKSTIINSNILRETLSSGTIYITYNKRLYY